MHNYGMFDWNDLRYFLAVARAGSTLAAAKSLSVSQPTVQRRLAMLEERIGRRLVERHPTGYRLTDKGKELLPHAERVEQDIAGFERQLRASDKELTGIIRITCPEADIDRLLAPVFARFQAEHPGLRLEFLITDRSLDLEKGEADIALRGGRPRNTALVGRKIADCPWHVYASRAYAERHGKPARPEDIERHAVIAFTGPIAELRPAQWQRSVAPNASIAAYSHSVLGALSAVKAGVGLGLLPAHVGNFEDELVCVLEPQPALTEPLMLLVHPDLRHTPRMRALLDFFAGEIGTIRALFRGKSRED
jgi:DNA-binding transcriptional LysR family regulator